MPDSGSSVASSPTVAGADRLASAAERANWLLDYVATDRAVSNVVLGIRSSAPLDTDALSQALTAVMDRHAALRSRFVLADAVLTRRVRPPGHAVVLDIVTAPVEQTETALRTIAERPFPIDASDRASSIDLDGPAGPLLRAALVRTPSADTLCLVGHHAIIDGTSAVLLTREVVRAYGALVSTGHLPPDLQIEAPEFSTPPPSAVAIAYWRRHLAGVDIRSMDLRCDRPRPETPTFVGEQYMHPLSGWVHHSLHEAETGMHSTKHLILLAAYLLVLSRHGAGPDLTVGVPIDLRGVVGRGRIGFHTHTVVLRLDISAAGTFRRLVEMTRDALLSALQRADASIDDVLELAGSFGESTENEYFRHVFNYFDFPASVEEITWSPGGSDVQVVEIPPRHCVADLELVVRATPDSTDIVAMYGTDVLDQSDALALVGRFETVLDSGLASPDIPLDELAWHTASDRRVQAVAPSAPQRWEGGIVAAIAGHARRAPDAVAVVDVETGRVTTYAALIDAAARLREGLQDSGVGRGDTVVLDSERRAGTIAGALAVWSVGAAYLPVDRGHPAPRVARSLLGRAVLAVLGPALDAAVLPPLPTIALTEPRAIGPWRVLDLDDEVDPEDVALVTGTSGSTGEPKNVCLTHDNLFQAATSFADLVRLGHDSGALWHTPLTFEPSTLEAFAPLVAGGSVVAASDAARHDSAYLLDLLARHHVSLIQGTPTVWRDLAGDLEGRCLGIDLVSGGEPLNSSTAGALLKTGGRVINAYGTTETAGWPVASRVEDAHLTGGLLPVGRPIGGHQVRVVDDSGRALPPGLRGEIHLTGRSVALGYAVDLDPRSPADDGHRTHPTGDIGRWCADGNLEVIGRADRQVKMLGVRVEPAEIEAVMESHPAVDRCGVIVTDDEQTPTVVAFVEVAPSCGPATLRAHALAHLAPVAVPARVIAVARLPRTDSGKVAHAALFGLLSAPGAQLQGSDAADGRMSAAEVTERLTEAWRDILGDAGATPATDFFAAGGNSMRAILLCERIEELTGNIVSLSSLLRRRSPAALAAHLSAGSAAVAGPIIG